MYVCMYVCTYYVCMEARPAGCISRSFNDSYRNKWCCSTAREIDRTKVRETQRCAVHGARNPKPMV